MVDLKKEQNPALKPENFEAPEAGFAAAENKESAAERLPRQNAEKSEPGVHHNKPAHHHAVQHVLPPLRDPVTQKIEKILEENVGEAYSRLSPIAKEEFKLKGEATAEKIAVLLKSAHVKVKKIFQLILEWLRMLPGINRFFLEQEAKIKTDRILSLHNRK